AVRGEVAGHRLAERVQASLARTVGGVPGLASVRAPGGHVDDPATASGDHVADRAPGRVDGAGQVDAEGVPPGRLPVFVAVLGDRVRLVDAGVVHQDVEAIQ